MFFFLAIAQSAWQFTIFGVLGSLGMGFNPAMQSVILALYVRRGGTESGRLFGALSVIQALWYLVICLLRVLTWKLIYDVCLVPRSLVRPSTGSFMQELSLHSLVLSSLSPS